MPGPQREVFTPLPPGRAFVVRLQASASLAPETLAGRVEHVQSGQIGSFTSLGELFAFMDGALESASDKT